jgi:hypothetical protein
VILSAILLITYFPNTFNGNPSPTPSPTQAPDISGVQVSGITPYAQMIEDGFATQTPYRFHVYIMLQIKNPTQYDVTLRLYGEVNLTLSGDLSGNYALDNTVDFSVPKYSQASYQIPIYVSAAWYSQSDAVTATINSHGISELWRGTGNPP